MNRRVTEAAQNKTAQSKAHKRPNIPCAWHFAFYRLVQRDFATVRKLRRSSGETSAAPPEKQGDYEQHKEYKKQKFRDACRCCCDTAESKDRCHKCDD
jgi:hypothetical protein